MRTMSEFIEIEGYPCKYHSDYYGWHLYRAWDIPHNHGKMLYFATTDKGDLLGAKNLDGIKERVREVGRLD